jgi:hypothetical protein
MGNFSELMKAGKQHAPQKARELHNRELHNKGKREAKHRVPSRNCTIVLNVTITQSDIDDLRGPTYSTQTMRLRESDAEILQDTAYSLGKSLKKKVTKSDVVRLAIRITQKLAASKDNVLEEVIGQMKQ